MKSLDDYDRINTVGREKPKLFPPPYMPIESAVMTRYAASAAVAVYSVTAMFENTHSSPTP